LQPLPNPRSRTFARSFGLLRDNGVLLVGALVLLDLHVLTSP